LMICILNNNAEIGHYGQALTKCAKVTVERAQR